MLSLANNKLAMTTLVPGGNTSIVATDADWSDAQDIFDSVRDGRLDSVLW